MTFAITDHTADIGVHVESASLDQLFADSATAFASILIDRATVRHTKTVDIIIEAPDLESLLYGWISELVYYFDGEKLLLTEFSVLKTTAGKEGWLLNSTARGEKFASDRHQIKTYVKAMTYSQLAIGNQDGVYTADFVLDI